MKEKTSLLKKYAKSNNKWSGQNFFFLNGKIFTGPHSFKSMIVTFTSSIIPFILFINLNFKVCKLLFIKFICIYFFKDKGLAGITIMIIVMIFLIIISTFFLFVSGIIDPGKRRF